MRSLESLEFTVGIGNSGIGCDTIRGIVTLELLELLKPNLESVGKSGSVPCGTK